MNPIQKGLLELKKKYGLSTSDLAVLLQQCRSTVLSWEGGVRPFERKHAYIRAQMERIHKAKDRLPVPSTVTQYERKNYLVSVVYANPDRIPEFRREL